MTTAVDRAFIPICWKGCCTMLPQAIVILKILVHFPYCKKTTTNVLAFRRGADLLGKSTKTTLIVQPAFVGM